MTRYKDRKQSALELNCQNSQKRLRYSCAPERHAASRWATAVSDKQPDAAKSAAFDASFGLPERLPVETMSPTSAVIEVLQAEEHLDPFNQFQSLQVSLTPQSRLVSIVDKGSAAAEAFRLWELDYGISGEIERSRKYSLQAPFLKRARAWLLLTLHAHLL